MKTHIYSQSEACAHVFIGLPGGWFISDGAENPEHKGKMFVLHGERESGRLRAVNAPVFHYGTDRQITQNDLADMTLADAKTKPILATRNTP